MEERLQLKRKYDLIIVINLVNGVCLDEVFLGGVRGGAPNHSIRRIYYLNKHVGREKENYRRAHGGCKILEQYEEEKTTLEIACKPMICRRWDTEEDIESGNQEEIQ